jgi:translation initiation factor IF-1
MSNPLDRLQRTTPGPDWQPGVVLEGLGRQLFRVQIEGSDRTLICHRSGTARLSPLKFREGSRVWVVAARNDPSRGRIVGFR